MLHSHRYEYFMRNKLNKIRPQKDLSLPGKAQCEAAKPMSGSTLALLSKAITKGNHWSHLNELFHMVSAFTSKHIYSAGSTYEYCGVSAQGALHFR